MVGSKQAFLSVLLAAGMLLTGCSGGGTSQPSNSASQSTGAGRGGERAEPAGQAPAPARSADGGKLELPAGADIDPDRPATGAAGQASIQVDGPSATRPAVPGGADLASGSSSSGQIAPQATPGAPSIDRDRSSAAPRVTAIPSGAGANVVVTAQATLALPTPTRLPAATIAPPGTLPTPAGDVVQGDNAGAAIVTYANDVLGTGVEVIRAFGWQGNILHSLSLPPDVEAQVSVAVDLAVASYAGLLANGAASVSYGSGDLSGDISAEVQSASLGAFSLSPGAGMPGDAAAALALAQAAYPGVADRPFEQVASEGSAFSFYAVSQQPVVDRSNGQVVLVAEAVLLNVSPARGQAIASAVVGRGSFADFVQP